MLLFFFFFNDTATTEIYTLSLHDALPISKRMLWFMAQYANGVSKQKVLGIRFQAIVPLQIVGDTGDRKSTRLNSSHSQISYAVFCLKKKKNKTKCWMSIHDI